MREDLLRMKFKLPEGQGHPIGSFVMRELDADDELMAAMNADAKRGSAAEGVIAASTIDQREALRIALVEVDGHRVNVDGIEYAALDRLPIKTMRYLHRAFNMLNGVKESDLKAFENGAEVMSPTATPKTDGGSNREAVTGE